MTHARTFPSASFAYSVLRVPEKAPHAANMERIYELHMGYQDGFKTFLREGKLHVEDVELMDQFSIRIGEPPKKRRVVKGQKLYPQ